MPSRPTALITGAATGLGMALADQFGRHGFDLILVGHRPIELDRTARSLVSRHPVEVRVMLADLRDAAAVPHLHREATFRGRVIDVLVNGPVPSHGGPFIEGSPFDESRAIQIGIVAATQLTRLVLADMIARADGRVLIVASTAGFEPGPFRAVDHAVHAYRVSLSQSLAAEVGSVGVTVACLCPEGIEPDRSGRSLLRTGGFLGDRRDARSIARRGYRGLMDGERMITPEDARTDRLGGEAAGPVPVPGVLG